MPSGGTIIRGEQFKMAFVSEATYGTDPGAGAGGESQYTKVFGVVQQANLPDPNIDFLPVYAMGTATNRNWYIAYKGKITLSANIPDIWLLNGYPLYLPIGGVVTSGPVGAVYTHTISEAVQLKSISMHVTYFDSAGSVALLRRFIGGKCGRATYQASEGDFLKMSLDEMLFTDFSQKAATGADYIRYNTNLADITPSYPTTQPYLFSYGALSLAGTEFARVKSFRLEVNNNLDAKYYVTNDAVSQLPYEYREGRRDYRLTCTIDIVDSSLYQELIRQGSYSSAFTGFQVILTVTRGTGDTITFTMPSTAPAAGGNGMGCLIKSAPHNIVTDPIVPVTLEIMGRKLGIVVEDAITTAYPGE